MLAAGCRTFFVATLEEALALRRCLDRVNSGVNCAILVLNGAPIGAAADMLRHRLWPVLNALGDVDAWSRSGGTYRSRRRCMSIPGCRGWGYRLKKLPS